MPARVARLRYCTWYVHIFDTKVRPSRGQLFFNALLRQEAARLLSSLRPPEISRLIASDYGPHSAQDERRYGVVNDQLRRRAFELLATRASRPPQGADPYAAWRRSFLTAAAPFLERLEPTYACSRRRIRILNRSCKTELALRVPMATPWPNHQTDLISEIHDCIRRNWKQCSEDDQARMLACEELHAAA